MLKRLVETREKHLVNKYHPKMILSSLPNSLRNTVEMRKSPNQLELNNMT
jgi:hypothetical protein